MFTRTSTRLALVLAVIMATAGCGAAGAGDSSVAISVDSSRGYPVVRSSGEPMAWAAEPVSTLGVDSTGESVFGTVRSVLLDSSGAAYVLDPSFHQIHVFEADGRFRAPWGRRGNGPGEFASPYSIAWLGDSMAVLDPGNSRVTLLGPDGRWAQQWTAERLTGGGNFLRLYRTPPRGFWMIGLRPTEAGGWDQLFVRFTSEGPADTLTYFSMPNLSASSARCEAPDGWIGGFSQPFGPTALVIPNAAGEQLVATTTDYRIAFVDRRNDTLRVLERPVEPANVTDAEWEEGQREMREWRAEHPGSHCDRTSWDRVATKPVLKSMFTDDEGQLWVEVLTASGLVYDVFGMDGRLRASVHGLPPSSGIDPSVVAGRIAIVVKDSLDVQSVRVFRLDR